MAPDEDWTVVRLRREIREFAVAAAEKSGKTLREWLGDAILAAAHREDQDRGGSAESCLIGKSQAMQEVFSIIEQVGPIRTTVMIYGKTGTEKKEVAKAIHNRSPRGDKPFLDTNCSGLAEHQMEADLFGHERGAAADVKLLRRGLLERTHGGTLFLDEIGDMPLAVQHRFARVMESRTLQRMGGTEDVSVDVRVIAGTSRDLKKAVDEGSFRGDLYYRLNVVPITLPDLNDRLEDIPLLANHFMQRFALESNRHLREIPEEAMAILMSYPWPGNVHELENVIERAVALARGPAIMPSDLPRHLIGGASPVEGSLAKQANLEDLERDYIKGVLHRTRWHQIRAAAILGIDRRTLYRKIRQYNLKRTEE